MLNISFNNDLEEDKLIKSDSKIYPRSEKFMNKYNKDVISHNYNLDDLKDYSIRNTIQSFKPKLEKESVKICKKKSGKSPKIKAYNRLFDLHETHLTQLEEKQNEKLYPFFPKTNNLKYRDLINNYKTPKKENPSQEQSSIQKSLFPPRSFITPIKSKDILRSNEFQIVSKHTENEKKIDQSIDSIIPHQSSTISKTFNPEIKKEEHKDINDTKTEEKVKTKFSKFLKKN